MPMCGLHTQTEAVGPPVLSCDVCLDVLESYAFLHLGERDDVISQQDGAPTHFDNFLLQSVETEFPNKWKGRGRPNS